MMTVTMPGQQHHAITIPHHQHGMQGQPNGVIPGGQMHTGLTPQMSAHDPTGAHSWMDPMNQPPMANDDTWSNSSRGPGPIVPTTLNVEDWSVHTQKDYYELITEDD
jgi:hypothetical protein